MKAFPDLRGISPKHADTKDDLPLPIVPTTATSSPGFTAKFILKKYCYSYKEQNINKIKNIVNLNDS